MEVERVPIALRAFTERHTPGVAIKRTASRAPVSWPDEVLILDTETTTDPTQRFVFGSYYHAIWLDGPQLVVIEEGIVYADDLPQPDAAGLTVLQQYVTVHKRALSRADARALDQLRQRPRERLRLLSQRDFLQTVFWKLAFKGRAVVVGFNLPFDLSRLARGVGEARGRSRGGFSFPFFTYQDAKGRTRENLYRPRLIIQHVDSKRAFIRFSGRRVRDSSELLADHVEPEQTGPEASRGRFLDLRRLTFALTGEGHTLDSAAAAFGTTTRKQKGAEHGVITPQYVDYNRQDVRVTLELLEKVREEFDRHRLPLAPWETYSPASIAKAYLRAMGLTPPREQFKDVVPKIVGPAMSSFHGGRAEGRIRRVPVPIVYTDFLSMYPTVNTLMRLWDLLTAERLELQDVTAEAQRLLDTLTVDRCFEPGLYPNLVFFGEIVPDADVLPVRARYDASPTWTIGVNPFTASQPFWYAGPDLTASTLLTGKAPRLRRAFRLVPAGRQAGLRPVRVRGTTPVDPQAQDFFKTMIEERYRLARDRSLSPPEQDRHKLIFKILANAGSYGIFAEMNAKSAPKDAPARVTVYGRADRFESATCSPEDPGAFCFPPLASMITAAARLLLALLERCVTDLGGTYAFCDTDSMAIVASEDDGLVAGPGGPYLLPDGRDAVRALSWAQVRGVVKRFEALNPYDPTVVSGSILKIEAVNFAPDGTQRPLYAYAIAAKRYALYTLGPDGQPAIESYSEHGLGHLLNPTDPTSADRDWMRHVWEGIVREALGLPTKEPSWLDRPALTRIAVSTPQLLKRFDTLNKRGTVYADRIKPFNFALAPHVHWMERPPEASADCFQLIGPYTTDPRIWERLPWIRSEE